MQRGRRDRAKAAHDEGHEGAARGKGVMQQGQRMTKAQASGCDPVLVSFRVLLQTRHDTILPLYVFAGIQQDGEKKYC